MVSIKKTFSLLLFISSISFSQNEWTWIKGSNVNGAKGIYGTKNVPSPSITPGARWGALSWTDLNGDLWLFGGAGKDSLNMFGGLSDMWKFDITLKQWIWVSGSPFSTGSSSTAGRIVYGTIGVPSASNSPGARSGSATWTDNSGNLWLFAGDGSDTLGCSCSGGEKNDLWMYNISTDMWTWMKGSKLVYVYGTYGTAGVLAPTNNPGARRAMNYWKDLTGNFWLFGGEGNSASTTGFCNDLWKYDIASNQWVWMKGSTTTTQAGVYGTIGVSNSTNKPGSRWTPFHWVDKTGNLWMYGGYGYDASANYGGLNDLWKYNLTTNQWTWMKGTNLKNQLPIYGTMNVFAATTRPGSFGNGGCWVDSTGNFWVANCFGENTVGSSFLINMMWKYNVALNQWTWVKGPGVVADQPGTYGTQNVSAISNIPGGRSYTNSWSSKGELWLFGGDGHANSLSGSGMLNDLWRFIPCYTNTTLVTNSTPAANYTLCNNGTTNLNATSSGTVTWYDTNNNSIGSGTLFTTPTLTTNQTNPNLYTPYTFLFGDNVSCMLSSITVSVFPNPGISISVTSSVICAGNSTTLNALSGAYSYTWNTGANTTTISVSPTVTTTYTVSAANWPTECKNTAVTTITVNTCTGLNGHIVSGNKISIFPNPNNGSFRLKLADEIENGELILFNAIGQKVFSQKIKQGENEIKTHGLAKGLYNYSVLQNRTLLQNGKIVIE